MPFKKFQYLPKQIFLKFFIQQTLVIVVSILLLSFFSHIFLANGLKHAQTAAEIEYAYSAAFLFLIISSCFIVSIVSLWMGLKLVWPLGRILVKARSILKNEYTSMQNAVIEPENNDDEWQDLESTLHSINKDIRNKERSLSREREEIETLVSGTTQAVVAVESNGDIMFFNSQFALIFEIPQSGAKRLSDIIRDQIILKTFRHTLEFGSPNTEQISIQTNTDHSQAIYNLSTSPLKNDEGKIYGVIGMFYDITELKRTEQVRIDFVANVSHELRTPLTSIKGYAQTLREDLQNNIDALKLLSPIEKNTDRLIALVNDLLSLSSLESGSELNKQSVRLLELSQRVLGNFQNQISAKKHKVTLNCQSDVLFADRSKIEQVLTNLLENAIKYIPEGGTIQIDWIHEGNQTILKIRDNGPGIPKEQHTRIFERFFRVDSARNREQGGTGLGLAIVKHIVLRHGGKISVNSELGNGTEFICEFPESTS
ncbi:MAG: ATP-binding protein [Oligoflexia bacterium]|nr:ATP-binding protein [Oligoflexia bacterium]